MTTNSCKCTTNPLLKAAAGGRLRKKLEGYLSSCRPPPDADRKKDHGLFPNLAGFCRFMGCGVGAAEELRTSDPDAYDLLCAVLEDEALNFSISPTVMSAYLKQRLGYGEKPDAPASSAECGEMRLVFEHDILEDGA